MLIVTYYFPPSGGPGVQRVLKFYTRGKQSMFVRNVKKEKKKYSWEAMVRAIEQLTGDPEAE